MSTVAKSSRYEVLAKIASGGMATVFIGRARGASGFSRLVAIKRPHPFVADDPTMRRSLEHEAHVASRIHHPHVVSVLDVEIVGDELALVLDYVEGGSLHDLEKHVAKTGDLLPTGVAVRMILDVAGGLSAAHTLKDASGAELGIVHRDVSPQNILVGLDGQARITDFGIAKIATEREDTATNVLKGKLSYLPLEYVEHRQFDARSDEYALAVVGWEALTGRRLFRSATEVETLRKIIQGPTPLSEHRPDLAALDPVFARALAKSPADRFPSVAAFAEALEEAARGRGWVASHAEVAAVVEEAVGGAVRQRRRSVEALEAEPPDLSRDAAFAPSPRDAMLTLSLPAGVLPLPPLAEASGSGVRPSAPANRWVLPGLVVAVAAVAVLGLTRAGAHNPSVGAAPADAAPEVSSAPVQAATPQADVPQAETPPASAVTPAEAAEEPSAAPAVEPRALPARPPRPAPPRPPRRAPAAATGSTSLPLRAPPNPYAP